ncbi:MAG: hypothetical protein KKB39_02130 [Nanoarchaeota archaeon]|nr:hypothetical protein [Nanoarchaeota archaeon]
MKNSTKIILLLLIILININSILIFTTVYKVTNQETFLRLTGNAQNSRVDICIDWFLNLSRVENQIAYVDQPYSLDINVTYEDSYYPQLNFSSNSSILFNINDTTGKIAFTPLISEVGNYTFNISIGNYACEDPDDSMLLNIIVKSLNHAPILNMSNQTNLTEDVFFYLNVSEFAYDPDGDTLKFYDNTSKFVIGEDTGIIAFTPGDYDVGSWWVRIFVVDPSLALDYQDVLFTVRNVNDVPNLSVIGAQTAYINETFLLDLSAFDPDPSEALNFSSNASWFFNSSGFINTTNWWSSYTISITFTDYALWFNTTHSINITIADYYNDSQDSEVISLTILAINHPPNITSYYPLSKQLSLVTPSCQIFNITKEDPDGTIPSTTWYINDIFNGVTSDSYNFCPSSAGVYNITVIITDGEFNDSESWIITVTTPPPQVRTTPSGVMGGPAATVFYCEELWVCSDWSNCTREDIQERECKDLRGCGTLKNKPKELQACTFVEFPNCFDGVKNQDEILPDCGGICKSCPTCDDGIKNQGELGVDCGGPCPVCKEVLAPVKVEEFTIKDLFIRPGLYWMFWLIMTILLLTIIRLRKEIKEKLSENFANKIAISLQVMKVNSLLKQAYKEADKNNRQKAQEIYNHAKKLYLKLPKDKRLKVHIQRQ